MGMWFDALLFNPTVAWSLSSHNFPTDRARELFKPSKEAEGLLASIKKIWTLEFELFLRDITTEVKGFLDDVIRT